MLSPKFGRRNSGPVKRIKPGSATVKKTAFPMFGGFMGTKKTEEEKDI